MPRASVILIGYNQAPFLRTAVESALAQTCDDFELLLVDNGSTDGSREILREYDGEARVRSFLFGENESVSRRLNDAIAASRGQFISFLYADDWYLPHKLQRQLEEFDRLPSEYGVVYGILAGANELTGARYEYPSLEASGDVFRDLMLEVTRAKMDMITPMIRRECLNLHPFDEAIFAETEGIYLRLALTHHFSYIDEPLAVHRDHGENAGKATRRNLEQLKLVLANLRADPALDPAQLPLVDRFEGLVLRTTAWSGVRVGADPAWVRRCFVESVRVSPRQAAHPKVALGLGLSALPEPVRGALNRAGHRLRRQPGNPSYVEDYIPPARNGQASSRDP